MAEKAPPRTVNAAVILGGAGGRDGGGGYNASVSTGVTGRGSEGRIISITLIGLVSPGHASDFGKVSSADAVMASRSARL